MHDFKYSRNDLYCESASVACLVKKYGSPLYIYSQKSFVDHYMKIKQAFKSLNPLICYSVKANSNGHLCKELMKNGAGFDIVSGGELYRALEIGASPEKVVYAGVGKTREEIEYAIKNRILIFNAESIPELQMIDKVAGHLGKRQCVAIRVNPDVQPKTHLYITTGGKENKFGIDIETAKNIFFARGEYKNLDIIGVHLHIGSQIVDSRPFVTAIKKLTDFILKLEGSGIKIKYFNIGGGLGIIYSGERPQTADEYARAVTPLLKRLNVKVILEPGRFIAGNSGILVTKVLYIKESYGRRFAIVDAAMNDLIRPSLYQAYHEILPVYSELFRPGKKALAYDIVGPVCESSDFFGKQRKFIELKQGSFLAVMSAGAYGFSMASNYNSRLRPAEIMVNGKQAKLIRRRETYKDLIRTEWKGGRFEVC